MNNEQQQQPRAFNPNEHLIQLKSRDGSKDYLPVQWRLVWFRDLCPQGTIDTEEMEVDTEREVEAEVFVWNSEKRRSEKTIKRARGYARYKAIVTDGKGGRATGTKSENAANFPDYVEKAETGAIGRALAALGYGTQFTGDEFNEAHRIVDSPVEFPVNGTEPRQSEESTTATQPTSSVNAPSPRVLRKRCDQVLGPGKFDSLKVKILKENVPDDNLTPEQCSQLNRSLDIVVERRKAQAS